MADKNRGGRGRSKVWREGGVAVETEGRTRPKSIEGRPTDGDVSQSMGLVVFGRGRGTEQDQREEGCLVRGAGATSSAGVVLDERRRLGGAETEETGAAEARRAGLVMVGAGGRAKGGAEAGQERGGEARGRCTRSEGRFWSARQCEACIKGQGRSKVELKEGTASWTEVGSGVRAWLSSGGGWALSDRGGKLASWWRAGWRRGWSWRVKGGAGWWMAENRGRLGHKSWPIGTCPIVQRGGERRDEGGGRAWCRQRGRGGEGGAAGVGNGVRVMVCVWGVRAWGIAKMKVGGRGDGLSFCRSGGKEGGQRVCCRV